MVGGTCRCTAAARSATSTIATGGSSRLSSATTTPTMRFTAGAPFETHSRSHSAFVAPSLCSSVRGSWCRPVVTAASSCGLGGGATTRNSAGAATIWGHYCCRVRFGGRDGRARGGEQRGVLRGGASLLGSGRLLRRDQMDFAMPHLMDTAPFRGVCQAPSRMRDARDTSVPMAFFGFGKSKLPDVVQVPHNSLHSSFPSLL